MESCATSHHWGRIFQGWGYTVALIPAQHVKPFVGRQKNDANDARAICEAFSRPDIYFVPVKSVEQQAPPSQASPTHAKRVCSSSHKLLFEKDNAWEKVLWRHAQTFSLWQITCVERMLACGSNLMGAKHYDCDTPNCPHTKVICQSCKTKACSSCGTKSTEQWINSQLDVMSDCGHQHITFTMPSKL